MLHFLKKPLPHEEPDNHEHGHEHHHHHDHNNGHDAHSHGSHERQLHVESSEEPHGEDIGQIAVDILETTEGLVIIAPLAGVPKSDVDVTISRNVLTISGNRPQPEIYDEAVKTPIKECFYGAFSRSIILPENLALDIIRATIERGMLIVTVPYLITNERTVKVEHIEDGDE